MVSIDITCKLSNITCEIMQAVIVALGGVRDADGITPPDVTDLLIDVMKHNDNGSNPYSDAEFLAAVLEAAGKLRPSSCQVMILIIIIIINNNNNSMHNIIIQNNNTSCIPLNPALH